MADIKKIKKIRLAGTDYDIDVHKDWQQNDDTSVSYIENRTHYTEDNGNVVQLDPKYMPIDNDTIKTDTAGKLSVSDKKLDSAPDGTIALLDENQKINLHYLSDAVVGQLKFGGTTSTDGIISISSILMGYLRDTVEGFGPLVDNATSSDANIDITLQTSPKRLTVDTGDGYDFDVNLEGFYFIMSESESDGVRCTFYTSEDLNNLLEVGDWVVAVGDKWEKIDNTDAVKTVNGKIGNIEITADELISAGDNITFTDESGKTKISAKDTTYTADNELLKLDGTKFTTNIIHKGTVDNSFEIFDGEATATYAIAAGTKDKSSITPIVGSTLAALITVNNPKAAGVGSLAIGGGAEAISGGTNAIGSLNRAGIKGLYYSSINVANKTITLSTSRGSAQGSNLASTYKWAVGDTVSFVNDSKYPYYTTITAISGNVITVANLPFEQQSDVATYSSLTALPDDFTIYACYKETVANALLAKNIRWYPRDGAVELGWAGTAIGVENLVTGSAAFASGWNNWAAGDFGATIGRDNISGYAGLTVGSGNSSNSDSAIVTGHGNEVTGSTNAIVGGGSNVVSAGQAIVGGYNNNVTSGSAGALVAGDTNVVTNSYCSIISGRNNTVSGAQSVVSGQYVKNTGGRNLVVGDRVADTVAEGETQTYTITEVTGNNNVVGGLGNTVSSNHSAAFGTRNSLTGNKGQIAAGSNNVLTNWNNAAFGRHLNVTTSAMTAVGQFNKTTTDRAMFVVGNGNANTSGAGNTSGKASEVCDNGTTYNIVRDNAFVVYYNGSYVGGYGHTLSDGKCNAISGWGHTVSGSNSLVAGRQNTVPSSQCIVAGQSNNVQSGNSGAMGYRNTINASCAGGFAVGTGNTIAKGNQLACGMWCASSSNAFFIVGNGSEGSPSNAFVVCTDGRATVGKDPSGNMDVATKQYVDSHVPSIDLSYVNQDVNIVNGHNLTVDGNVTINGDLEFNGDIAFGNFRASTVNADEMYVAGKRVLVEGDTVSGGTASFPTTAADGSALQEGAVLVYRGGQWVAENPPTTIYTGEVE